MKPQQHKQKTERRKRGFERTSSLLQSHIRKSAETRGFAVTRMLTHWADIVGEETARIARPVSVKYGRGSFGATLTLLTTGAQAPMLEMQKEQIRTRVNQVYGHAAISAIRITQTAKSGFADGKIDFDHAPKVKPAPNPQQIAAAKAVAAPVENADLRAALELLGENVLSRKQR
ncbi:DUF721 domain-containing protein [Falsihalocynthiibacter sp. SS001]|uniref:DUF721 domain-containing protein n=1 Tax=Falsihalocynthiibacter sp. SS001 TaxID=3349698 RepID=UPI0036D26D06